jgi:tetratricopeptide (TPR) repeat protein
MKVLTTMACVALALGSALAAEPAAQQKLGQGIAQFQSAEYPQALATFKQLESTLEARGDFQYFYGLSLLKTGQPGAAIERIKRAIEIDPRNADYRFAMGLTYAARMSELSLLRAALLIRPTREALTAAVELNPRHAGATLALAELLLDVPSMTGSGREEARELLNRLRAIDVAAAALLEAKIEENKGGSERVERLLLQAVDAPGSLPAARLRLARLHVGQRAYVKAIRYAREYLDMPRPWSESSYDTTYAHLWLAVAYHALGDTTNYARHAQAVNATPLPPRLRKEAERIYQEAGIEQ